MAIVVTSFGAKSSTSVPKRRVVTHEGASVDTGNIHGLYLFSFLFVGGSDGRGRVTTAFIEIELHVFSFTEGLVNAVQGSDSTMVNEHVHPFLLAYAYGDETIAPLVLEPLDLTDVLSHISGGIHHLVDDERRRGVI